MSTEPRVQDFTDHRRRLPLWVEASPVYELLLGLFAYSSQGDQEEISNGSNLIERIENAASPDVKAKLDELAGCGGLWLTLLGVARTAPLPHDVDGFVTHLQSHDAVVLRRHMLRNAGYTTSRGHDAADLDLAASGDATAVASLLGEGDTGLLRMFQLAPEETRDGLVDLLCRVDSEIDLELESAMVVLERDAAETRAMAATMDPADLVERVTNGVTFEPRPGLAGIVLIPSIVIKPWVVISEHADVRIFSYPVSDEHMAADPATPPSHLVEIYKALGDERRLRILYLLGGEPRTLGELADKIELAKSTTHHHLRVLRQAGLVRVVVGDDDKRYELRETAVPEAGGLLSAYLGTGHPAEPAPSGKDSS
jgi:DNA-binding transcriptional ArsR family regulator